MHLVGRPRELSVMRSNMNADSLAFIKRKAERNILPKCATFYPNGLGVDKIVVKAHEPIALYKYADMDEDTLGIPLVGNLEEIHKWFLEQGVDMPTMTVE